MNGELGELLMGNNSANNFSSCLECCKWPESALTKSQNAIFLTWNKELVLNIFLIKRYFTVNTLLLYFLLFIQSCDSLNSLSWKNCFLQIQFYQLDNISRSVLLMFFLLVLIFSLWDNFTPWISNLLSYSFNKAICK